MCMSGFFCRRADRQRGAPKQGQLFALFRYLLHCTPERIYSQLCVLITPQCPMMFMPYSFALCGCHFQQASLAVKDHGIAPCMVCYRCDASAARKLRPWRCQLGQCVTCCAKVLAVPLRLCWLIDVGLSCALAARCWMS
jgi:hypothetical protein